MKPILIFASITLALLLSPMTASAQSGSSSVFGDAQAVVEINLEQFRSTGLGKKIMAHAKEHALKAIEEHHDGQAPGPDDINEFLGFDPFVEIRGAVIAIDDLENPEENLAGIIQLGETTGNIEGLLLGLPGYESSKEGGTTIHSADLDGQTLYAAIYAKGKNKAVVIAPEKGRLISALEQAGKFPNLSGASSQAPFIRVSVNQLPTDLIGDGPQANVAKLVKSVELTIAENGDDLAASLSIATESAEQAEQIRQMADGLKALLGFAMAQDEDEDLKQVVELAKGLKVTTDDNRFNASLSVPVKTVLDFLQKEANMSFPD